MQHVIIEFKARCGDLGAARLALRDLGASEPVVDHQVDTYFVVPHGRLKLREGAVERSLIHYHRPDQSGPKRSDVTLVPAGDETASLKEALSRALGVLAVVDKRREILWIDNVKLHLDEVKGLGTFVEVEAIGREGLSESDLRAQCERLLDALDVHPEDLVAESYSDLVMRNA